MGRTIRSSPLHAPVIARNGCGASGATPPEGKGQSGRRIWNAEPVRVDWHRCLRPAEGGSNAPEAPSPLHLLPNTCSSARHGNFAGRSARGTPHFDGARGQEYPYFQPEDLGEARPHGGKRPVGRVRGAAPFTPDGSKGFGSDGQSGSDGQCGSDGHPEWVFGKQPPLVGGGNRQAAAHPTRWQRAGTRRHLSHCLAVVPAVVT